MLLDNPDIGTLDTVNNLVSAVLATDLHKKWNFRNLRHGNCHDDSS